MVALLILLVASEERDASFLCEGLRAEGHAVEIVYELGGARAMVEAYPYDAAVVVSGARRLEGAAAVEQIRGSSNTLPIVAILPERCSAEDRARVLNRGADDCICKPAAFVEVIARVRAVLRRGKTPSPQVLRVDDLELHWEDMTARRSGRVVRLTQKEFALLAFLMQNAGRHLSRPKILDKVWGVSHYVGSNIVDVYIAYLRSKVDKDSERKLIHTSRGVGYYVAASSSCDCHKTPRLRMPQTARAFG